MLPNSIFNQFNRRLHRFRRLKSAEPKSASSAKSAVYFFNNLLLKYPTVGQSLPFVLVSEEPNAIALQFSSACATVRMPGMGIIFSLCPHSQAKAPCAKVRPSLVKISRTAPDPFAPLGCRFTILEIFHPFGTVGATHIIACQFLARDVFACQQTHRQWATVDGGKVVLASQTAVTTGFRSITFNSTSMALQLGPSAKNWARSGKSVLQP